MGNSSDTKQLQSQLVALEARVTALEKLKPPVIVTPPPPAVTPPPVVNPPVRFLYPADVVGKGWKVTLENGKDVKLPELATCSDSDFRISDDGKGVMMRCHFGGGTTPNSNNPRCEWREMSPDGKKEASWSATTGRHRMRADIRVDRLVDSRPYTVLAQIHDASNDITVFRLESSKLWITNGNNTHSYLVTSNFRLGVRNILEFDVSAGVIHYLYNGLLLPYSMKSTATGLYYKSGVYLQANRSTDPAGSPSEYTQATVYSLTATHS